MCVPVFPVFKYNYVLSSVTVNVPNCYCYCSIIIPPPITCTILSFSYHYVEIFHYYFIILESFWTYIESFAHPFENQIWTNTSITYHNLHQIIVFVVVVVVNDDEDDDDDPNTADNRVTIRSILLFISFGKIHIRNFLVSDHL